MAVDRRAVLAGAAASLIAGAARSMAMAEGPTLKEIARSRGLVFGSEVVTSELQAPDYARLYFAEAGAMTAGQEAKWDAIEPKPGQFDFAPVDRLVSQAVSHGMLVRLHTLVWPLAMPDWANHAIRNGAGATILERHIRQVVGHFRGHGYYWDVANEVSDPRWGYSADGLTHTPWYKALGPDYVATAFHLAREADPTAKLFLNDDELDGAAPDRAEKRTTYLRLLSKWKQAGVPIDGFGLESHLHPERGFAEREYRHFLHELAQLGLEIHITEMDVVDRMLPADRMRRDQIAADTVRRYLDVTLDERAVRVVMTWGLSNRTSWLNSDPDFRRPDGLPVRGLPYDADLLPTLIHTALAAALAGAPQR